MVWAQTWHKRTQETLLTVLKRGNNIIIIIILLLLVVVVAIFRNNKHAILSFATFIIAIIIDGCPMLNDLVCEEYSVALFLQMPQAQQFAEKWPIFLHLAASGKGCILHCTWIILVLRTFPFLFLYFSLDRYPYSNWFHFLLTAG